MNIEIFFFVLGVSASTVGVIVMLALLIEYLDRKLGFPWGGVIGGALLCILIAAIASIALTAPHPDTAIPPETKEHHD